MQPDQGTIHPIDKVLIDSLNARSVDELTYLLNLSDADWYQLLDRSKKYALACVVYNRLKPVSSLVNIPREVLEEFDRLFYQTAIRNMQLYGELDKLLKALQNGNISSIVLKGAYLAQEVYNNLGLRPMKDIDLLVRKDDLPRVDDILSGFGYKLYTVFADREWYLQNHYHLPYLKDDIFIELHWQLDYPVSPLTISTNELWEQAQQIRLSGVDTQGLSPEHLLIHSSLQASFQHPFDRQALRSIYDIHEIVSHFGARLDWSKVSACTLHWRTSNPVYLALSVTQALFEQSIPNEALLRLEPQNYNIQYLDWAVARVFSELDLTGTSAGSHNISDNIGQIWASQSTREKIATILKILFPSPSNLASLYNKPKNYILLPLLYPVHVLKLLFQNIYLVFRLLRRDPETLEWVEREKQRTELIGWMTYSP